MQNLGDYHDLYLRIDFALLADAFENFISICLKQYKLDPEHYYTSPGWPRMRCFKRQEWCWNC